MKNSICNKLNEIIPNPICPLNYSKDYELLLAVMLSAQTTDARVNALTKELFKYNIEELATMDIQTLERIIKPLGTYRRKAIYIKEISKALVKDFEGKVPYDRKYIENLKGVGHKTCNVVFSELFKEPTMPVDTHVSRVSKKLGLAEENDDVKVIEKKLMDYFDKKDWNKLHLQLVLFGRHHCTAKKPNCEECPFYKKECIHTKKR